jgi:hypothetical protein
MRIATLIARLLMGLVFFVFGLNGFLMFMPMPKDLPPEVMTVMGGFMGTHYLMPLISGTQVVVGALLLANCFVPLALALIAPVVVNIVCYHVFFFRQGLEIAIVVGLLEVFLAYSYRRAYAPMLAMRVSPN